MTTNEISRKASEVAGCLWDDRSRLGTLADQLRAVANEPPRGVDGDLTNDDRSELIRLADESESALLLDRITSNPEVMEGKPCIRGLRMTVETLLGLMSDGAKPEHILAEFPYLEVDDVRAALAFSAEKCATE